MSRICTLLVLIAVAASCNSSRQASVSSLHESHFTDTLITQSLFSDKTASISEENIQRILDGKYQLPDKVRIAIVKLDGQQGKYSWNDEAYLKNQQAYADTLIQQFRQSPSVSAVTVIPAMLMPGTPTYTSIREAAVRMQADVVAIYTITGDLYSKYRLFNKTDIKAFATTQLILLDVRTGLIPFTSIITKDHLSQKNERELNYLETTARIQNEAVLLTLNETGQKISNFLNKR
ncbi:MAG: hypothetical protein ACTHLE_02350 [Agriterribacter sp.]